MGTCAVRREPSGVGNGVGVNVGVGVEEAVGAGDGVPRGGRALGLGAGVDVSGVIAVGDGDDVEVAVGVGDDVGNGVGLDVAVGVCVEVPNKPAVGSRFPTRANGDGPARDDGFNPSCRAVSKSSRTARNQKRAIARNAEIMAGIVT
jgi:hypothetical protein